MPTCFCVTRLRILITPCLSCRRIDVLSSTMSETRMAIDAYGHHRPQIQGGSLPRSNHLNMIDCKHPGSSAAMRGPNVLWCDDRKSLQVS